MAGGLVAAMLRVAPLVSVCPRRDVGRSDRFRRPGHISGRYGLGEHHRGFPREVLPRDEPQRALGERRAIQGHQDFAIRAGMEASCTTCAATEPSRARRRPERPCVLMTTRLAPWTIAARPIPSAGSLQNTSVRTPKPALLSSRALMRRYASASARAESWAAR